MKILKKQKLNGNKEEEDDEEEEEEEVGKSFARTHEIVCYWGTSENAGEERDR